MPPLTTDLARYHAGPEAIALAQDALIVDGHIDVPYRLQDAMDEGTGWIDTGVRTTEGDFDAPRALAGGLDAPFMSIYIPPVLEREGGAYEMAETLIGYVERMQAEHEVFTIATSTGRDSA